MHLPLILIKHLINDFLSKLVDGLKLCQHFETQVQLLKPTPLPNCNDFSTAPKHHRARALPSGKPRKYILSCDTERDPSNNFSCFFLSRSHYEVFVLRKFFCCITLLSFKQSKYDDFKFNFLQINTCCAGNICRFLF